MDLHVSGSDPSWRRPENGRAENGRAENGRADQPADATPLRLMFRWKWWILAFSGVATLAAGTVIWHLAPRYTAEASVMIDVRQMRVINADGLMSSPLLDESLVRSDMEVFSSLELARSVVLTLGLNKVPEFCGATARETASAAGCEGTVDEAARQVLGAVSATNDGRSYIIKIRADAGEPALAASIANAYAAAFVALRQTQRNQVGAQATTWLSAYVEQLRSESVTADAAVAKYRNSHHLLPVRGETSASQSMAELTSSLSTLGNEIAEKQSIASQVQDMLHGGGDVDAVAPLLNSPLIQGLLDKEAELASTEAELKTQYGSAHPQVVAASARLEQMQTQVRGQIARSVEGLSKEVAALNQRKAILASQMTALQENVGQQGTDDVGLQELDSNATSARAVFLGALTRLREIEAERGMEQSDAHLASEAFGPKEPSFPHKSVMLLGAFIASLGLGAALAFALSLLSRVFRDAEHLEADTGLRVLGFFPRPSRGQPPAEMPLDTPISVHGDAVHAVLVNMVRAVPNQPDGLGKVVVVTSAMAGEGKTSLSLALGRSAMRSHISAVLLDCDLRRPSVEALLRDVDRPRAQPETVGGEATELIRGLIVDRASGLPVIPALLRNSDDRILSLATVRGVLTILRRKYDLVLLDMPPVLAVADALTLSPLADGVVLVVDAQRTPRAAFGQAVQMLRRNGADIAGAVFSKADLPKYMRAYGAYRQLASPPRSRASLRSP